VVEAARHRVTIRLGIGTLIDSILVIIILTYIMFSDMVFDCNMFETKTRLS